jgi:hypothetical protein
VPDLAQPPGRAPLAAARYDEAVSLLAELLLDAGAKRRKRGQVLQSNITPPRPA